MNKNVKFLVESGIMIALASVLSMVKVFEAPFGGSVTAGSMIPIVLIALRWGTIPGLVVGLAYGTVQAIIDPYIVHPIQFLLDYPIAFGLLGLAGLYKDVFVRKNDGINHKGDNIYLIGAIFIGIFGRFFSHVLAGVVFFSEYAGDSNPWIYSMLYNGGYLGVELLITAILMIFLWRTLRKIDI